MHNDIFTTTYSLGLVPPELRYEFVSGESKAEAAFVRTVKKCFSINQCLFQLKMPLNPKLIGYGIQSTNVFNFSHINPLTK